MVFWHLNELLCAGVGSNAVASAASSLEASLYGAVRAWSANLATEIPAGVLGNGPDVVLAGCARAAPLEAHRAARAACRGLGYAASHARVVLHGSAVERVPLNATKEAMSPPAVPSAVASPRDKRLVVEAALSVPVVRPYVDLVNQARA